MLGKNEGHRAPEVLQHQEGEKATALPIEDWDTKWAMEFFTGAFKAHFEEYLRGNKTEEKWKMKALENLQSTRKVVFDRRDIVSAQDKAFLEKHLTEMEQKYYDLG
ncbi:hypothetical protein IPF86_03960 [Candidatus Nomurabacteria bacterium]|jgi:hypothetical protein|nr:MAG: hypothetical protein IPF86_03960 [Candidatus Nomurabacteria bacterium]